MVGIRGLAILLAFAALSAGAAENRLPTRTPQPRETGIAPPARIPPSAEAVSRDVRRAVAADAAKRFGVGESEVVLTRAEQVTWNDGSLGCAEPGRMYTQSLIPGYLIVAKTSAGELAYHTDSRGFVVSCGASRPVPANKLSEKTPVRGANPTTQQPAPER
jgi:hypothetical protein